MSLGHSSGVYARTVPFHHECKQCDWKGMVDADYDPEINDETVMVTCDDCGEREEIHIV